MLIHRQSYAPLRFEFYDLIVVWSVLSRIKPYDEVAKSEAAYAYVAAFAGA
jgi:hypothetical protein